MTRRNPPLVVGIHPAPTTVLVDNGAPTPRYHFNVYDGRRLLDEEGTVLPDIRRARQAALATAGELIRDSAKRSKIDEEWRMEVTDGTGLLLFRLDFVISDASAAR